MKQRACPVSGARANNEQRPMECSGARSAGGENFACVNTLCETLRGAPVPKPPVVGIQVPALVHDARESGVDAIIFALEEASRSRTDNQTPC